MSSVCVMRYCSGANSETASAKRWHGDEGPNRDAARVAAATADRLAVSVEIRAVAACAGYVATEVDGKLSFNVAASVAMAHQIIDADRQIDVGPERARSSNSHRHRREASVAERPIALPHMNRGSAVMWPGDYSLVKPTTGQFTRFPGRLHRPSHRAHQQA